MIHNPFMDDVYSRVDALLKMRGLSWADLARATGYTEQRMNNWKRRGVPTTAYKALAGALRVSLDSLVLSDVIDMPSQASATLTPFARFTLPKEAQYAGLTSLRGIEVVGTARMSEDGSFDLLEGAQGVVEGYSSDPQARAYRIKGDVLFPSVRDGQFIIVEPEGNCVLGEWVVLILLDGRKLIREYLIDKPDSIVVASINGGARETIDREQIVSLFPVAGVMAASKWRPAGT